MAYTTINTCRLEWRAVEPAEGLENYTNLLKDVQCLSCQNEALEDANLELAQHVEQLTQQVKSLTLSGKSATLRLK